LNTFFVQENRKLSANDLTALKALAFPFRKSELRHTHVRQRTLSGSVLREGDTRKKIME
jgi:hypothetical protein